MSPAAHAVAIGRQLGRLRPDWSNPERYFENRHEIERELRRLAKQLEREHG